MIRVLVVDDLKMIYEGLKSMFAADDEINIVGHACNGKEAIKKIANDKPDVILIDILMPVMGGIETTTEISKLFPEVKVIVLSGFEDDPIILEAIAAGAKGYLLKNMITEDLASAIRSVHRGSSHFAPGIIDCLAKTAIENSDSQNTNLLPQKVCTIDYPAPKAQPRKIKAEIVNTKKLKETKPKEQKPLFKHGDWITIILCVIMLSQTNGMGHHLAHAGLFFLMLSLLARPIKVWWNWPLKHRRTIGIFAFAAAVAHSFYATFKVLDLDFEMMLAMSPQNQWGIGIGIISLLVMTPAAVTSFQFFQKKLGKQWRQIHLLTVPALALAVLHTVLVGPHYMSTVEISSVDYLRTIGVIIAGSLVLLMRRKIFWSSLNLNSLGKKPPKNTPENQRVLTNGKAKLGKNQKELVKT
jgi:DNA-binding NarL/FixJ family response regulator/DMSO/TMAO reductase YedYZ heme-binding membrane subunit